MNTKMKKTFLSIMMCLALGMVAKAQMMIDTWGLTSGVDTTLWMDISGHDTTLIAGGNKTAGRSGLVDIGFPFSLGESTHTQFSVNVNGTVRLGSTLASSSGYYSQPLGSNQSNGPKIEPYGYRARFDDSCYTRMALLGDSGSRVLVVETRLMENESVSVKRMRFQVQLFESGGLRIVYGDSDALPNLHTTQNGVVAATGTGRDIVFINFCTHEVSRFEAGDAYCSLTNSVWPAKGRWYMLAPDANACPHPPTVTTTGSNPASITFTSNYTGLVDLRLLIPQAEVDTVFPKESSYFTLAGYFNPATTYYGTVQSLCDSGRTSFRTSDFSFTTTCGTVEHLPWTASFRTAATASCWDATQYTSTSGRWTRSGGNMRSGSNGAAMAYDEWLVAPVFNLPDTDGLTFQWDYKSTAQNGANPEVEVRVAPCVADGTVDSSDWVTLLSNTFAGDFVTQYLNLDAYRGQRVKVAFVRTGSSGGYVYVTNVQLYQRQEPLVEMQTPGAVRVGDTVMFGCRMLAGSDSNVTYNWHSSLLDTTIVTIDTIATIEYPFAGWDTVTLVASNVYGSDTLTAVVDVLDCGTVTSFPWTDDFSHNSACWTIDGWMRADGSTGAYNESGTYGTYSNVYYSNNVGAYMLTQPVAIPATGAEHLALWAQADGPLMVRVSTQADSLDTAYFTDTLMTVPDNANRKEIWWRTANLAAYVGQTIRFGFFRLAGTQAFLSAVRVDYDTLPTLGQVVVPAKSRTDSTIVCTATQRFGAREGTTYTWHSTLTDTTIVTVDTIVTITYTIGGTDTITVVLSNAYGADTAVNTVKVIDCTPTAMPWTETFTDGIQCWYQYPGGKFYDTNPFSTGGSYYDTYRSLCINTTTDTAGSWIISKEIQIPSDSNLLPIIAWKVASSGAYYHHLYSVLVTDAEEYTDTANYVVLYTDSAAHSSIYYNYNVIKASLADYVGRNIHIAFHNHGNHVSSYYTSLYFDEVEVRSSAVPVVTLSADKTRCYHGDTVTLVATLEEGHQAGLAYTWHSSLLDTTIAGGDTLRISYGMVDGWDTVRLVASNAYGNDTATLRLRSQIILQPSATITHSVAFVGDTTEFVSYLDHFVYDSLRIGWHSSLLDTTVEGPMMNLVYDTVGVDTVILMVSNRYGSDTTEVLVAVSAHPLPQVTIGAPSSVTMGDAALLSTTLNDCSLNDLACRIHSTMSDSSWTLALLPGSTSEWTLDYSLPGNDTIIVVVSNRYGADTTMAVVQVFDCTPRQVPYTEDFENVVATSSSEQGSLPGCWDYSWNGSNANFAPHVIANGGYQYISNLPSQALFMVAGSIAGYGSQAEVLLPHFADSLQSLSVAFDYRFESTSYGTLEVGYYADSTFVSVKTMVPQASNYRRDTVAFANATVADARIALRWTYGISWYAVAIDSIEVFHTVPSFMAPRMALSAPRVANVGDTAHFAATVSNLEFDSAIVVICHSTMNDTTVTMIGADGQYGFDMVYMEDGVDTLTAIATNVYGADTVTTVVRVIDCSGVPVPYIEDFSGIAAVSSSALGQLPDCWQHSWSGSHTALAPHVITPDGYQYMNNLPDNALFMIASGRAGYNASVEVRLPHILDSLQRLSLALDYRFENASVGTLQVGYYDDSVFVSLKTLPRHSGSYRRDTVSFANATVPDGRMAILWSWSNYEYAVAIDNIEVYAENDIPGPDNLTVDSVNASCATVSWQPVDSVTTYWVSLPGVVDTAVNDTVLTLCGLTGETTYRLRVAAFVDGLRGHYSPYVAFTTGTLCAPLADVQVSPDGVVSWQYADGGDLTPTGVVIEVYDFSSGTLVARDTAYASPYFPDGTFPGLKYTYTVRTLCSDTTSNTASSVTVTRQVHSNTCAEVAGTTTNTSNRFMDNYWRKSYSQVLYPATLAANVDTLYGISLRVASITQYYSDAAVCYYDVYVGQTSATLTSPLSSDSLTRVAQNAYLYMPYRTTPVPSWVDIVFDTPYVVDGTGNLIVTIVDRSYVSCIPVYGMHTDTASIHFVQASDHGNDYTDPATLNFNWETNSLIPDIRLLGGCAPNVCIAPEVTVVDMDTHRVSLDWQQLGAEDRWLVEYRALTDSSWTTFGTVATTSCTVTGLHPSTKYLIRVAALCADTLYGLPDTVLTTCSYIETPYTINFVTRDEIPCWALDGAYRNYWRGIELDHYNDRPEEFIVSPEVAGNITGMRALISAGNNLSSMLNSYAVGVCNADGSGVVWIDTLTVASNSVSQQAAVYFNHYTGSTRHIILQSVAGYVNIESFTLEDFSECIPAHDVQALMVVENSAQLQWRPEDTTHNFAVYLNDMLLGVTSGSSYTITGLAPNTQYTAAVREICGVGDTAVATSCLFQTLCVTATLPYEEHFDEAPLLGNDEILPDCWTFVNGGPYSAAYCDGDVYSLTYLVLYGNDEGATNYVASQRLMVGPAGAIVRFKGQSSYGDTLHAGIMTDPFDPSTFIPAATITMNSRGLAWYEFRTDTLAGCSSAGVYAVAFRWGDEILGSIDSLIVIDVPVVTHTLTLSVNDTAMGTVSGSGTFIEGTNVTITATPNEGYHFVMWNDSVTADTRTVKMDYDTAFTAFFAPDTLPVIVDTVWRTVSVTANVDGSCETYGSGRYADSSVVEIGYRILDTLPEGGHWQFLGWSDGPIDNPRNILVVSDTAITALFEWVDDSVAIPWSAGILPTLTIYPNPAHGDVTVTVSEPSTLTVIDLTGRTVIPTTAITSDLLLPASDLPAGTYFVQVTTASGTSVKKLIMR